MKHKVTSVLALCALATSTLLMTSETADEAVGRQIAVALERQADAPFALLGSAPKKKANSYLTAQALRLAAEKHAWGDFWNRTGAILNDTSVNTWAEIGLAWQDLQAQLTLVTEQFNARTAAIALLGGGAYHPQLDPANFSANVTNPYFPLVVGQTMIYERQLATGLERVESTTTDQVVMIDGFPCRAVRVIETVDGHLVEETTDWYSQDSAGNVWYFGELTMHYGPDGFLEDIDGSWRAGKDGAKPGIVMKAAPAANDIYRQEFLVNQAEDMGCVLSTGRTITVAAGTYTGCIRVHNSTPVEPDENEVKWYAPGIGLVADDDDNSGQRLELIQIIN